MADDPEEGETFIPYSKRAEWSDVIPVPQDDGKNPIVSIAYSEKFREVYDYFRAILLKDERSERSFQLTTDAILLNPSNYSIWHFRRILIQELKKDLNEEMKFTEEIILEQPKNYQIWYHRQRLVVWSNNPHEELRLTNEVLKQDGKNYHAWQHRQWVIRNYKLWQAELDYASQLIRVDFRNNSAWNQRYFVISNTSGYTEEVLAEEVQYTLGYIKKAPNNESSWNYLNGILQGGHLSKQEGVKETLLEMKSKSIMSPFLYSTLAELLQEELAKVQEARPDLLEVILQLYDDLATKCDVIRKKYWEYKAKQAKSKFQV